MEILICERNPELVGTHIMRLQKVFDDSAFDYAEDGQKALEKITSRLPYYGLILSNQDMPIIKGDEIYQSIRKKGFLATFILCFDETPNIEENINDELFCLRKSYSSQDIERILDTIIPDEESDYFKNCDMMEA